MPYDIFTLVAKAIKVGIFNSNEFPCDFPEYAPVNTECKYACPDHCSSFCDEGMPIAMKWSHPGARLVVTAGNLLCGQDDQFDPEFGRMNLLVQDFAESLIKYVLPTDIVDSIITAYNSSKLTWDLHPSNHINYFRQGTAAWFRATSKPSYDTGGMTICSDARPCGTEAELRRNILTRDAPLFDILSSVYTHERWNLTGDISVCMW
ncbi:uncharacterized protein [Argopecten irradians]|uniref:uncharacterized protein n=1 Tax=Argopecten irradians TaxID=31199 RepID=UPI003715DCE2